MRLSEAYRPRSLSEVVGQPSVRMLQAFVRRPYPTCWLFTGEPGVGKSATALALAADLGAVDEWSGLRVVPSNKLGVSEADAIVRSLHLRPMGDSRWNVLILEELERLSQQATVYLKVALASEHLPPSAVVIATSNDTSGIDQALLERFGKPLIFDSRAGLAEAFALRLAYVWQQETDQAPLPNYWRNWGWSRGAIGGRFSARRALDDMQQAILEREASALAVGELQHG